MPSNDVHSEELREQLKDIVTRKGMSARIPEILKLELDDLMDFISTHTANAVRKAQEAVTRFEVIDHRECVWCRGRKTENRLIKNEYKEMPCNKCDGSGIMGGRVYSVNSNPETSIIQVELSYQDDGRTLKVFVSDHIQSLNEGKE